MPTHCTRADSTHGNSASDIVMPAGGLILNNLSLDISTSGHSLYVSLTSDGNRANNINTKNNVTEVIFANIIKVLNCNF